MQPRVALRAILVSVSQPGLRDWKKATPTDAMRWLAEANALWWIAGGWALELYCGRQTRDHADLDVGCFREDLPKIRAVLPGWVVCEAHEGRLTQIEPHATPRREVNSLWCRTEGAKEWWFELLLDERDGENWVFRRSSDIRRCTRDFLLSTVDGTPYLRPELQLLYKAKNRRPQDEEDFRTVLPLLDEAARRWLADALQGHGTQHPWIEKLDQAG